MESRMIRCRALKYFRVIKMMIIIIIIIIELSCGRWTLPHSLDIYLALLFFCVKYGK